MLKKIYFYLSIVIIPVLILVIIFLSINLNDKNEDYYDWINQEEMYVIDVAEVGNVKKTVSYPIVIELNKDMYLKYYISKELIKDDITVGKIIFSGDALDKTGEVISKSLGRVEEIIEEKDKVVLSVSDFSQFKSTIYVEQIYSGYITIGQNVEIILEDKYINAKIVNHSYKIIDGFLKVEVIYQSDYVIYEGTNATAKLLITERNDVLRISKDALIIENELFYVNTYKNNVVSKIQVEIGLIGDSFVEIKNGITKDSKVIIN